jgi:catechol 2,3-dioxygenase-like lactoylglutathione lyase family enzyme
VSGPLIGLDHAFVTIPRGAEDEARRFYGRLLELEEIPKPSGLGTPGAWFRAGGQELHLGAYDDHVSTKRSHPGFRLGSVSALEELASKLVDAGYDAQWDERIEGRKRFYTRDPFGNRLELLTDL